MPIALITVTVTPLINSLDHASITLIAVTFELLEANYS